MLYNKVRLASPGNKYKNAMSPKHITQYHKHKYPVKRLVDLIPYEIPSLRSRGKKIMLMIAKKMTEHFYITQYNVCLQ